MTPKDASTQVTGCLANRFLRRIYFSIYSYVKIRPLPTCPYSTQEIMILTKWIYIVWGCFHISFSHFGELVIKKKNIKTFSSIINIPGILFTRYLVLYFNKLKHPFNSLLFNANLVEIGWKVLEPKSTMWKVNRRSTYKMWSEKPTGAVSSEKLIKRMF